MKTSLCENLSEGDMNLNKDGNVPSGVIISIDKAKDKVEAKLNNKFEGINFRDNQIISEFSINLDNFFARLNEASIKDKNELYVIIRLLEEVNKYITLNKDLLLENANGCLTGIKLTYNDINQSLLKRIDMLNFLNANEINKIYTKTNTEYTNTYYLFVPPDTKELPKDINPSKYIKKIKTDKSIYTNSDTFNDVFDGISNICTKLMFQTKDLSDMSTYQLNELIYSLEEIEKQLLETLNDDNKKKINDIIKNKIKRLSSYYLSGALRNIKKILFIKEIPIKINFFNNTINDLKNNSNFKHTSKNSDLFTEFMETHRNFMKYLYMIENSLGQINKEDLEKLIDTIQILKNMLIKFKNVKDNDSSIWRKVLYNSNNAFESIKSYISRNNLPLTSE